MRKRLFVRSAATLAVACLASAGVASSAHADDDPPTGGGAVAAEVSATQATGGESADVVVVELDEPSPTATPPEVEHSAETTPAADPADPSVTTDPAPEAGAGAPVEANRRGIAGADAAGASADAETGTAQGPIEAAADAEPTTEVPATADAPDVPTVADVAEAIDDLPGHVAGEPLTLSEARAVAAAVCGAGELCVGAAEAYLTIQDAIDAAAAAGFQNQVIRVFDGLYPSFTVTIAVQILAAEGANVIVANQGGTAISVQSDDVTIEGLSLMCTDPGAQTSIGIESIGTAGLSVDRVNTSYCDIGVLLAGTVDAAIVGSFFGESPRAIGVVGVGVTDIRISGNYFNGLETGVFLNDFDGVSLQSNFFTDLLTGAHFSDGSGVDMARNLLARVDVFGVVVDGVQGFTARENSFIDAGQAAIAFKNSPGDHPNSGVLLERNYFSGPGLVGVNFEDESLSDTAILRENGFWGEDGWTFAALAVSENVGGFVDASDGNLFGWCGPNAVTQNVDLGGADVLGSASVLRLDLSGCRSVTVPPVVINQTTCQAAGTYTLSPLGDAAVYGVPESYDGEEYFTEVPAGTYALPPTGSQVAALSNLGHDFGPGVYELRTMIPAAVAAQGCDPVRAGISSRPASVVAQRGSVASRPGPVLAETGADGMGGVLVRAGAIVALGGVLVAVGRRRTAG